MIKFMAWWCIVVAAFSLFTAGDKLDKMSPGWAGDVCYVLGWLCVGAAGYGFWQWCSK